MVLEKLKQDYIRCGHGKKAIWILLWYRLGNYVFYSNMPTILKKVLIKILKILNSLFVQVPFAIEINFEAKIGTGIRLIHLQGIVIHSKAVIGKNCTIFHQVTIGANEHANGYLSATIGDNVYIGCGAKIIGNINIGNNVRIGANAVVVKDIPENATVVCNQRIIIKQKNEIETA